MRIFKRAKKKDAEQLSNRYRNMILDNESVELITSEDYDNLITVAKYAEFGRSTAIQAAFYLGYKAGKGGAE